MKSLLAVGRYLIVRTLMVGITLVVGCYLIVIIMNMGGKLDDVRRAEIRSNVASAIFLDPSNRGIPADALKVMVDELAELEYERLGLDRPFFPWRSLEYLFTALSLKLGTAEQLTSDTGSRSVARILSERLPATLVLFGTSNLLLFFLAIQFALFLSRRYGSLVDRTMVGLAPLSSAPGWFYGIFLILIFAAVLRVLPWGGLVQVPPPDTAPAYALSLLEHMILPVLAITIGALFANVYRWRTFFLIYSSEDYVELAKAKGLSARGIQRRYIMRPTLPTIITSLMLILIGTWQGQIILETVFNWPGLGRQYLAAVNLNDTPVILGTLVIYGYLLAGTLLLLEFIYALVDPRVRVGGGKV
ncbi:MAG: ABC transporter permease [Candidatus Bipolaricaulis sp.]|nr:ABC transporter permease [Candidatus Bipolaricaulis sp.]